MYPHLYLNILCAHIYICLYSTYISLYTHTYTYIYIYIYVFSYEPLGVELRGD